MTISRVLLQIVVNKDTVIRVNVLLQPALYSLYEAEQQVPEGCLNLTPMGDYCSAQ